MSASIDPAVPDGDDSAPPHLPPPRILIVDDRPANLVALEALLGSFGHEFVSVQSGAEALASVEAADFAVVLLDVQMPSMDGFETALELQKLAKENARGVPIIFVTAIDTDRARIRTAYAHGAVDFLQKPFEPDVLRAKVSTFVELFRAKQRLAAERELARKRALAGEARLQTLTDLALGLSGARTRSQVVEVIVDHGTRLARADTCTLYVLDRAGAALELVGDRGVSPDIIDLVRRITDTSGGAPTLHAMRAGTPMWAENLAEYEAIFPTLAAIKTAEKRAHAFWSMPLVVEGRAIGVLGMGFYEARTFSPAERSFVGLFVKHCAQALQRALLLEREDETRRWFSTTLQSIGDAVIATDPEGRVAFMNAVAERLTGWSEREALGQPMEDVFRIFSEATGDAVESPVRKVLREGNVVGLANHTVLRTRGGAEIPIDDSGAPIRDESGKIFGVVLVFRDVTEEKRAEKRRAFLASAADALISSLDYRQTLATVARLAVPLLADWCTIDIVEPGAAAPQQLAVAHVDPAKVAHARELGERYPADPAAVTGSPQVIRSGKSELYSEIPAALLEAGARDAEHLRIIRELRLESAMVVPFPGRDGRTLGAMTFIYAASGRRYTQEDLAFAEDFAKRAAMAIENAHALREVTDAREREQAMRREAERASTTKDEFLATVSHELRTPLNAILGWTSTLRRRQLADEADRALGIIERNARAQARLIEDVLDVSRISSGKLTLALGMVDVGDAVRLAVEAVRPAAEAKGITLVADSVTDGAPVTMMADADRVQQILWNLLTNALKFTPRGGGVEVSVARIGSEVAIEVVDTGEGIRAEALGRIFDPFRQADSTTTRRHGGLGLGLALVKQLTAAHGGSVEARSEGEGKGASFVVRLPARAVTPALARPSKPSVSDPITDRPRELARLDGLRLLIVDDEADARELVGEILQELGAVVELASSAAEAEARMKSTRPDVIVCDIGMPHVDGYAFIRALRAATEKDVGKTPAVALTAYSRPEDVQRALAAGFQRHLAKPVDPAELAAIVATLGGRREAARA